MRTALIVALFSLGLAACQPEAEPLPTLAALPARPVVIGTLPPTPLLALQPTQPPTLLPSPTPSATPTLTATVTATASPPPPTPTLTPTLLPARFTFGQSVQGRPLEAYRFGTGSQIILLVGGVHAGFERNTTRLIERIRDHLSAFPQDVAADVQFILVPRLNPDGDALGATLAGRFNANGVDLNRNWACGWQAEARFRDQIVSAGTQPFSEPETLALGGFIQQTRPAVVLFYHSAANGVFNGHCNDVSVSEDLAQLYGDAAQYPHGQTFSAYPVTGTAPSWVDSLGIPSADVELASASDDEFIRNWNALNAVQRWLTEGRP